MLLPSQAFSSVKTDKIWRHGYGEFYDFVFASLIGMGVSRVRVLEIGVSVFGEGSGHAWSRLPNIEFVGVDIEPIKVPFSNGGRFIQGDAYSREMIEKLRSQFAPFHLVIDDGTHTLDDQQFFFENYTALCATPSIMICEDVHNAIFNGSYFQRLQAINLSFIRPNFFGGENDSNLLVLFKGKRGLYGTETPFVEFTQRSSPNGLPAR